MSKERLLILDGNSIMNRAFYALPTTLINSEGFHTNAILGFTTMLLKMKEEIKPDYIVTAFDRKAPTFRHEEYKDYKAGRKKMPEELREQFPVLKELLKMLAIDIFEIDGFEADDLIGTLSVMAEDNGLECYIVTGDKDELQLATDDVKVVITKKGITEKEIYDRARMLSDFEVTPKQFIDVKGLMGDASDNIPGVPGVGEKTAFKLIKDYGSLENVLSNIDSINGKKLKENLTTYAEQAVFSKKLATIITNVPVEIDLASIKSKESYDLEGVRKLFFKLQFNSLLEKLPKTAEAKSELKVEEINFIQVEDSEEINNIFQNISGEIYVLFDVQMPSVFSKTSIKNIFLSTGKNNYILPVNDSVLLGLKPYFEDGNIKKISHDVKGALTALRKLDIELKGLKFDTAIAAYLIDSSKGEYELLSLIQQYMGIDLIGDDFEIKAKECSKLKDLYELFSKKIIENDMEDLYYNVELPLIEVLSFMEWRGFNVKREELMQLGEKFKTEISAVEAEIYVLAKETFNINSPKQLGKILFEKLDLPVIKKTKTGYSTNAEVLEELSEKHPIIDKITYYRQLAKLYSTYVEGLQAVIDTDGRIHSSFNQTVTATGRLSSTEPNLQNIPIKYEMGREIRKVFVPDDTDSIILSADYSQIELRVLAHIASDNNLIDAFKNHVDIHTKTASEVFKVPLEEVTHAMRSNAKAVNFGIVYGIGDFSLSKDLKISKKEAKSYIDTYFERYPNVKKYMVDIVEMAKEKQYVTTIMNRKRFIPEISGPNKIVMAFGQRLAMNTPIQGSAADIIKLAMVKVYKRLKEEKLKSTMILQVHDELILNVYKDEAETVSKIVKESMEKVMELRVPLEVDINFGANWYEAK